jgi:hypothetical protein
MSSQVIVAFARANEFTFSVSEEAMAVLDREAAHRWLDKQLNALECESSNPVGKTLLLDKILNVAKYGGESRFAARGDWAHRFATAVARLLGRPVIRVDVGEYVVG